MEPNKCDDLKWFNINELPENTIIRIRNVIKNMKKGIIYDDGDFHIKRYWIKIPQFVQLN